MTTNQRIVLELIKAAILILFCIVISSLITVFTVIGFDASVTMHPFNKALAMFGIALSVESIALTGMIETMKKIVKWWRER